jgi:hypothetical protein
MLAIIQKHIKNLKITSSLDVLILKFFAFIYLLPHKNEIFVNPFLSHLTLYGDFPLTLL